MQTDQTHRDLLTPSVADRRTVRSRETSRGTLRRWLASAHRRWQRRKMIAALEAMDSRMLRDLGIYRGDIPRLVDGFDSRQLGMVPIAPAERPDDAERKALRRAA